MKGRKNNRLSDKIAARIRRRKTDVFLRSDFEDLGGYDQVGRSLRELVGSGALAKIGYGLYARTMESPLSGRSVPVKSVPELAAEALGRLNVETVTSSSARAYNDGRSTQVPTGRVIAVRGRVSRKIGFDGAYITYERGTGS